MAVLWPLASPPERFAVLYPLHLPVAHACVTGLSFMECCGDLWLSLGLPVPEGSLVPAAAAVATAAASGALVRVVAASTCEICGRHASRACACGLRLCGLGDCARRQHVAPGGAPGARPHYPLLDAPGALSRRLALQQFDAKRLEDAELLELQTDGRPPAHEAAAWRELSAAAARAELRPDRRTKHDPEIARFWKWTQCSERLYLAIFVPVLRAGGELDVEASETGALRAANCTAASRRHLERNVSSLIAIQFISIFSLSSDLRVRAGGVTLIDRRLAGFLSGGAPIEVLRSEGGLCVMVMHKEAPGLAWRALFAGDSDGIRSMAPPYTLSEGGGEVELELPGLPFWTEEEDVLVRADTEGGLRLSVGRGGEAVRLERRFWRPAEGGPPIVDFAKIFWHLSVDSSGAPLGSRRDRSPRTLTVLMALREPTEEERAFKQGALHVSTHYYCRECCAAAAPVHDSDPSPPNNNANQTGVRQDHRTATHPRAPAGAAGARFFLDDEDEFGLEPLLQAACFARSGATDVPPEPWAPSGAVRRAAAVSQLSDEACTILKAFSQQAVARA
jgi:hypothetical protein